MGFDPPRLGKYSIKAIVASGGFGRVYLGLDESGYAYAVKLPLRDQRLSENAHERQRFVREIETFDLIDCPFVPRLVAHDVDHEPPWFATPYIAGPSLKEAVDLHGPLSTDFVLTLASALCDALSAIHEGAGRPHRDVKPGNVLIAADRFMLIDMGLAGLPDGDHTLTRGGLPILSAGYVALEHAQDMTRADRRADIYSLAATLVFAATSHPVYDGTQTERINALLRKEPPNLGGLPDELGPLVRDALSHRPEDRPDIATLRARLARLRPPAFRSVLPEAVRRLQLAAQGELASYQGLEVPLPPLNSDGEATRRIAWRRDTFVEAAHRVASLAAPEVDSGAKAGNGHWVPGPEPEYVARLARLAASADVSPLTVQEASAEPAPSPEAGDTAGAIQLLDNFIAHLVRHAHDRGERVVNATIVELDHDACHAWSVTTAGLGASVRREWSQSWRELLRRDDAVAASAPVVPAPRVGASATSAAGDLVLLLLAGGACAVPPGALDDVRPWSGDAALAQRAAERIVSTGSSPMIVLRRRRGWSLIDATARRLASQGALFGDAVWPGTGDVPALLEHVLGTRPLQWPIGLVTANVNADNGAVTLRFVELFAQGTDIRPGRQLARTVRVAVPPAAGSAVSLPVVAHTGADPSRWVELGIGSLTATRSGPSGAAASGGVELTVRFEARDQVRLTTPTFPSGLPADPDSWPRILEKVPLWAAAATSSRVNLIVALERGSADGDIAARRQFAVALLERARQLHEDGEDVDALFLSYGDHPLSAASRSRALREPHLRDPEIKTSRFGLAAALAVARGVTALPVEHDFAAPVEDVLAYLPSIWRRGERHALVFVGSRPAHPRVRGSNYLEKCTNDVDWGEARQRASAAISLVCAAVIEPLYAHLPGAGDLRGADERDYARTTWSDLVTDRMFALEDADPDAVLKAAGLLRSAGPGDGDGFLPLAMLLGESAHDGHTAPYAPWGGEAL